MPGGLPASWNVAASLALHVVLLLGIVLLPQASPPESPPQEGIAVEILTPRQFESAERLPGMGEGAAIANAPPGPAASEEPPPPESLVAGPGVRPPGMIRVTRFLSAASLADPHSREARLVLRQLAGEDRLEQLCAVEAMDQIHAWRDDLRPDRLVAYATADPEISANAILADGGAFRSEAKWYEVRFRCEVTPDREKVVSFEFLVGDPIPEEEWERRNLPAVY